MTQEAPPPQQRGFLPWLAHRSGRRPLTARRAVGIIIVATVLITISGGITIRLLDRKDFSSLGEGMWWAIQTVTTVGYGDVVPHGVGGRIIGSIVMLTGIAFLSLVTASVTALLVEQARQRRQGADESVAAQLDRIDARLEAIEARLESRSHQGSREADR
jgi:voltage-gated potassium channel